MSDDFDFSSFSSETEDSTTSTETEQVIQPAVPTVDVNEFNALKQQLTEQLAEQKRREQDTIRFLTGRQAEQQQLTDEELLNLSLQQPLQYKQMIETEASQRAEQVVNEKIQQFLAQQRLMQLQQEFTQKHPHYSSFWGEIAWNASRIQQESINAGRQMSDNAAIDEAMKSFDTRRSGIDQAQRSATVRNQALSLNPGRTSLVSGERDLKSELDKLSNKDFDRLYQEEMRKSQNYG